MTLIFSPKMNVSPPWPLITRKAAGCHVHALFLWRTDSPIPAFAANDTNDAHPAVFLDLENYDSFDRGHQRLRYSTIESVLQGLWIFLYQGRRELDAVFHIEDGGHRLVVGFGKVYGEGVRVKFA